MPITNDRAAYVAELRRAEIERLALEHWWRAVESDLHEFCADPDPAKRGKEPAWLRRLSPTRKELDALPLAERYELVIYCKKTDLRLHEQHILRQGRLHAENRLANIELNRRHFERRARDERREGIR